MISGFNEQPHELADLELRVAKQLVPILKEHIGEAMAITNAELRIHAQGISPARIRKVINYIRTRHLVFNLVATSNGYYVERDPVKLRIYVESLRARAAAINAVADSYGRTPASYPVPFNQTRLFA